ncbi:hypothetical protein SAMN05444411_110139 [Lutibacter oricola]|uniref:Uncharacterized protein n=1 Tax=Lutibacter oricola TaxID=762486 RepID=A0A1H3F683_9FLAO|nr:hypothetical protein [Lutibacter oricola]SDX86492.1 hypothetical protein SAMN05444411_110139 [Lutibacter oricola]
MIIRKDNLLLLPEVYLIIASIFYWVNTSTLFNPFAIIFIGVLLYQVIIKNKIAGLLISSVFILLNLYMVLALISELSEFTTSNNSFIRLLVFGVLFLGLNLIASIFMFKKHLVK